MSHRPDQLGSVIHRAVQSVIERGLSDPRIRGVVTVTSVRVTPDMRTATIHVVVTPDKHEALTMHGLRAAARHIRRKTGDLVALKQLPEFHFSVDEGYKRELATHEAISRAARELELRTASGASRDGDYTPEPEDAP